MAILVVRNFRKNRLPWSRKKLPAPVNFRVLVALRRRPGSMGELLRIQSDVHTKVINNVANQWRFFYQELNQFGTVTTIFRKTDQGLPNGSDEDWFLIAFLDILNYEVYRECIAVLEKPEYRDLRNFCDVRLILSDIPTPAGGDIRTFF